MIDWLNPQILETFDSSVNGKIKIQKYQGKIVVYAGNTQQSSPWVEKVWSRAINNLPAGKAGVTIQQCSKVLILGLGAGAIIPTIIKKFPEPKITGVEIDPAMIKIGQKYFSLSFLRNLSILSLDALYFIQKNKQRFDLILIDLYLGQNYPLQFESQKFLQKLSQTLSKNGFVIFNRLTTKTSNFEPEKFIDKLSKFFKIEKIVNVDFNTLIVCSRR